jgi:hypothetical protein
MPAERPPEFEEGGPPASEGAPGPVRVYISYAHQDKALLNRLVSHLAPLEREKLITLFYDDRLPAGVSWRVALNRELSRARIALFLVSADALASEEVGKELRRALKRQQKGELTIIPVLLRPCMWEPSELGRLICLPRNAVPITEWENPDAAFLDVLSGIRAAAQRGSTQALNPVVLIERHPEPVRAVAAGPDGIRAISGSDDGYIIEWDLDKMSVTGGFRRASGGVIDAVIAPDQTTLLIADREGLIHVYDLATGKEKLRTEASSSTVRCGWLDGAHFIQIDTFGNLRVFDVANGAVVRRPAIAPDITAAAILSTRGELATGHRNGACHLWRATGEHLEEFSLQTGTVVGAIAASADGRTLAATNSFNTLTLWDVKTGEQRRRIVFAPAGGKDSEITGLAVPSASTVVIASKSGNINLYDIESGKVSTIQSSLSDLLCLAVTPDGRRAITGHGDGSVALWNLVEAAAPEVSAAVPGGDARLELAYYAVLDNPQIFEVLETFNESVLAAVLAQSGRPSEETLAEFRARHKDGPPPLWAAWVRTMRAGQLGGKP